MNKDLHNVHFVRPANTQFAQEELSRMKLMMASLCVCFRAIVCASVKVCLCASLCVHMFVCMFIYVFIKTVLLLNCVHAFCCIY